jgi:hypothetical protein
MPAEAKHAMPPKFNQNSTRKNSAAEKFSCFPTLEEEGADEFTGTEETQSEIDTENAEFETPLQGIYSITEDKRNPFAACRPFIPQKPVFQNSPAQSWWSASSPPEYSSLEPTLTSISAIDYLTLEEAIKPIPVPVSTPHTSHRMKQPPQHSGKLCKPTTKRYRHSWNRHWPELNRTSKGTRTWRYEYHDHPERSKPSRPWKQRLPSLDRTNMNQNTKSQNMPQETDPGNAHQLFTQCPSRICSSTTSKTNTPKTRSWGTRWRKWSSKIPNWHKKFPALMRHLRRSSKRTPSWDWSPRPWPCTCSSDITMDKSGTTTQGRRTFPHGGNHFPKRGSESENKSRKIVKTKITGLKTKETKRTR